MVSLLFLSAFGATLTNTEYSEIAESSYRARFIGRSATSIAVQSKVVRWPGGARVRLTPRVEGLPVEGASVVFSLDPNGREIRTTKGWRVEDPVRGTLKKEEAITTAQRVSVGRGRLWEPRAEQVALVVAGEVHHAWKVTRSTVEPLQTWAVWVDAVNGEVLQLAQTGHDITGRVFDPSPFEGPPVEVELEDLSSPSVLSGRFVDSYSCKQWDLSEELFGVDLCVEKVRWVAPPKPDYSYTPTPGWYRDPFAEVNLYYHVTRAGRWWEDHYSLRRETPFTAVSNFPMANAFYGDFDGDGLADLSFGYDGRHDYGYDGEVVYHEFGHWVVARLAEIPSLGADENGLDWVGGSLNEGVADVFSMLLEPDPRIGEYAGRSFGDGPIRDLERDRQCPEHLVGEVHHDGEIIGALGWNMIESIGVERTSDIFVGAVATWGMDISWDRAGQSLLESADDLFSVGVLSESEHQIVGELVAETGMIGCPRVRPVQSGEVVESYILSAGLQGDLYRIPGQNQISIQVPADAERLVIRVKSSHTPEGLGWSFLVREGEAVENEPTALAAFGLGFAAPKEWDWVVDSVGDMAVIEFDASSDPPLTPGTTYFIEVAGRNTGSLEFFEFTRGQLEYTAEVVLQESSGTCNHLGSRAGSIWAILAILWGKKRCSPG